jgi:hypothetical protein
MEDRKQNAYHEAGHAIVDTVFGFRIRCVTIEYPFNETRCVEEKKPILDAIATLAAGAAAQARYTGMPRGSYSDTNWRDGLSDKSCARQMLEAQPDISPRGIASILEAEMDALFEFMGDPGGWAAVVDVAELLYERRKLSGDDVDAVWARHPEAHDAGSSLVNRVRAITFEN